MDIDKCIRAGNVLVYARRALVQAYRRLSLENPYTEEQREARLAIEAIDDVLANLPCLAADVARHEQGDGDGRPHFGLGTLSQKPASTGSP